MPASALRQHIVHIRRHIVRHDDAHPAALNPPAVPINVEPEFWDQLRLITLERQTTMAKLITEIDRIGRLLPLLAQLPPAAFNPLRPPTRRGRQGPLGTYFPDAASSSLGTSIFLDDAMICTTHNLLKLFALAKAA